jgi:hypothetical protein
MLDAELTSLANRIAAALDEAGATDDLDLCARALHLLLVRIDRARYIQAADPPDA